MQYSGTYTGIIHTYCAEFNYSDPITFTIDDNGTIDLPSYATGGYLQDGTIDAAGHVSGLSITVQSRSLGTLKIPYNASDDGHYFSASGTSVNGITSVIQANLVPPVVAPSPVTTIDNGDGTHTVTGTGDDLTLQSVGNDLMTGGGVRDTFVFTPGFGQNEITDFVLRGPDHDVIDLTSTQYHSLAQVIRHTTSMADGTAVFHLNPNDSIMLDGITKADLKGPHPHIFAFP